MSKDLIRHAKDGNLVKFSKEFANIMNTKVPPAMNSLKPNVANSMFTPKREE